MLRALKCIKAGKTWQVMQCDENYANYAGNDVDEEQVNSTRMHELGAAPKVHQ